MPGWKFWEKENVEPEAPAVPEPTGRFNIRPRTDLVGGALPTDDARASRITVLRKRRDGVLFDVEQAELAGEAENPWLDRVSTIEEARRAVDSDLRRLAESFAGEPGMALPSTPVSVAAVAVEPAPTVAIRIDEAELVYVEDLDWAERGNQLARTELHLESGDVAALIPPATGSADRAELIEVLGDSLFAIASDARDRAAANQPMPPDRPLSALAVPDFSMGGWTDVNGSSPRRRAHAIQEAELRGELDRLLTEKNRELEEMARWRERLPVAQRRLRDLDAEIAAALVGEGDVGGRR